jgi:hypothetical protein
MSTELANTKGSVPALRHDPSTQIERTDLALPRLYIAQDMHSAVQEGFVKRGSIFVATDSEDPSPDVLSPPGGDGVRFYYLGLRKGKSLSVNGELFTYRYDDPDAPAEAWTTYTYFVYLPAYADDLPVRWLLTRTGRPTAQKINTVLARQAGKGPLHEVAFEVTAFQKQNDKGKFFVPRVQPTEARANEVEIAADLASTFGDSGATQSDEPAI